MSNLTPVGKLSKTEALKSFRDLVMITLSGLLPQLLALAEQTNFGEYNNYVSIVLMVISPFIMRYFNIARLPDNK